MREASRTHQVGPKVQPVFIGGTGRSGTTILGKLIGMHEQVCLARPIEARYITDNHGLLDQAFGKRNTKRPIKRLLFRLVFGEKQRELELAEFEKRLFGRWWSKPSKAAGATVGLEHSMAKQDLRELFERFKRESQRDARTAARNFLLGAIEKQSNFDNQPIWVDTSPPNIENSERILKLWPEAKFIYIKRDGRDTAASIVQERWGPDNPIQALDFWAEREAKANEASKKLSESQLLVVTLEDLAVNAREETYSKLLDFLELDHSVQMREFFAERVRPERAAPGSWVNRVSNPEEFERHFLKISSNLRQT